MNVGLWNARATKDLVSVGVENVGGTPTTAIRLIIEPVRRQSEAETNWPFAPTKLDM